MIFTKLLELLNIAEESSSVEEDHIVIVAVKVWVSINDRFQERQTGPREFSEN